MDILDIIDLDRGERFGDNELLMKLQIVTKTVTITKNLKNVINLILNPFEPMLGDGWERMSGYLTKDRFICEI